MGADQKFQMFLQFVYPDLKDFAEQFLTLVTGVLAFSVTFGEKVIGTADGFTRRHIPLFAAWLLFLASIVATGYGLWRLFGSAEVAHGWYAGTIEGRLSAFDRTYSSVYLALNFAGVAFVLGLGLLAFAAALRLVDRRRRPDSFIPGR